MSSPEPHVCLLARDCQSQRSLTDILNDNQDATAIWGDHAVLWNFTLDIDHYTLPFFFLRQANLFSVQDYQDVDTSAIFNFMINKKMIHRYLTARLVEYYNLENYNYTYSGSCKNINDDRIFRELDLCDPLRKTFTKQTMMEILGNITIPPRFIGVANNITEVATAGKNYNYGGNYFAWKTGLHSVFSSSLLSLITESDNGDYDKVTVFTEKTVYAILGLTIPVWPGGYRHATMFEAMGFDVFPDLINHAYQFEDTIFMRCWRAFKDNLDLLKDLSKAKQIREAMMPRLLRNREYLLSKKFVDWYSKEMENWPPELKNIASTQLKFNR